MNDFSLYMQVQVTVFMQATYKISPSVLASEPASEDISLGLPAFWILTSVAGILALNGLRGLFQC